MCIFSVILRSPYVASQFLTFAQYKQMSGRNSFPIKFDYLFLFEGRAGRTGQSQTGECYVIAHERDMKQVNLVFHIYSKQSIDFPFTSFEKCYLP